MRSLLLPLAMLANILAQAQWDIPTRVILDGPTDADRQITGLADPLSSDAAISAEAVRSGAATRTLTTGSDLLIGGLTPALDEYSIGLVVTIVPETPNDSAATLNLNGLGERPLVRASGEVLQRADLFAGIPARFIYDGSQFRLLGNAYLPCPEGFHVAGREFCIEDSSHASVSFFEAITTCAAQDARLCTYSEWVRACENEAGFLATVADFEWVDDAANTTNGAKRVGNGGDGVVGTVPGINCRHGGWSVPTAVNRYRCCSHR
jgi:hypothetical protein